MEGHLAGEQSVTVGLLTNIGKKMGGSCSKSGQLHSHVSNPIVSPNPHAPKQYERYREVDPRSQRNSLGSCTGNLVELLQVRLDPCFPFL